MKIRTGALLLAALLVARFGAGTAGAQADGSVVTWGYNSHGQCTVPAPNSGFAAVAAGWIHSLGLKSGAIQAWGANDFGQCNVPSPNSGFTAVAAGWVHSLGRKSDGSIVAWGWNDYGQCTVPAPNTGFTTMAAGWVHSLGRKADGSVVTWGNNNYGQCNVPSPNTGFTAVGAGHLHSVGLKSSGSIVAWGSNDYGQCTVPSPNSGFVAIASGDNHCLGLKSNGSIVAWGRNDHGQCNVPSPNSGFIAVAAGYLHSAGLKSNGSIVAWGDNGSGQCTVPSPNSGFTAVAAGGLHSLGLRGVTTGACCATSGSCSLTSQSGCVAPSTWQGAGTSCSPNPCPQPGGSFVRGDADASGETNIGDCVAVLRSLGSGYAFKCDKAADFDDSGETNITDAIRCLRVTVGTFTPPAPYPACGPDPTPDSRTCGCFPVCGFPCLLDAWTEASDPGPRPTARLRLEIRPTPDGTGVSARIDTDASAQIAALQFTLQYDPSALRYLGTDRQNGEEYEFFAAHDAGGMVRLALVPDLDLRTGIAAGLHPLASMRFDLIRPLSPAPLFLRLTDALAVSSGFAEVAMADAEVSLPPPVDRPLEQPDPAALPVLQMPNPYQVNDAILFSSLSTGAVEVAIYNVGGQKVRTLFTGIGGPGPRQLRWDGQTDGGERARAGIYFVRAQTDAHRLRRTLFLTR